MLRAKSKQRGNFPLAKKEIEIIFYRKRIVNNKVLYNTTNYVNCIGYKNLCWL